MARHNKIHIIVIPIARQSAGAARIVCPPLSAGQGANVGGSMTWLGNYCRRVCDDLSGRLLDSRIGGLLG